MPIPAQKEKDTVAYAGSCNPPRRAKRARTEQPAPTPATTIPAQRQDSSDDEDEYDPGEVAPTPKRRGRKPGTMSRSARESQRKLNHSRIEKARRTKINDALATLSELVNDRDRQVAASSGSPPVDPVKAKGRGGEKEFKLDVLVKAVSYMQELITRVGVLESRGCDRCQTSLKIISGSVSSSTSAVKRKRAVDEVEEEIDVDVEGSINQDDEDYTGDDEKCGDDMDEDEERSVVVPLSRISSLHPTPSPRLPPIASWLPHPYVDPSCIAAAADSGNVQLPSPPLSSSFRPSVTLNIQSLPALTLPAPARPFHDLNSHERSKPIPISPPSRRPSNAASISSRIGSSPTVSPTWTPEDENAASLLLQMSSSPPSSVSSSSSMGMSKLKLPQTVSMSESLPIGNREKLSQALSMQIQTPSSMLGM
ncbi:hypothetical protein C8Q75DRAFT_453308 [Abortiporus biennis]|nr:hypothetical protein C8Q75DRAFT_453308 [Abortiporus biennis]